jgi:hypothetical protein
MNVTIGAGKNDLGRAVNFIVGLCVLALGIIVAGTYAVRCLWP